MTIEQLQKIDQDEETEKAGFTNNKATQGKLHYQQQLKIATLNIRGDRYREKRKRLEEWMKKNKIDERTFVLSAENNQKLL